MTAHDRRTTDLLVLGGGLVGLAVAHAARAAGRDVLVVDDGGARPGAWRAAAGMLAPVAEADFGEEHLLALSLDAAARWPAFAASIGVALHERGTLVVARDADDAEVLERLHALHRERGLAAERLLPTKARRLEGGLAPTVRLALHVPGDHAVDPRALHAALRAGLELQAGRATSAPSRAGIVDGRAVAVARDGAELADGTTIGATDVVLATGAWSGELGAPVRPVRGVALHLVDPRGPGLCDRVVRSPDAYLVPRGDGRYVLGATSEDRGFDPRPLAGGLYELLRDMGEVIPGVLELEVEEVVVGFRPGTADNVPLAGRDARGVVLATGHGRNGVLLAPLAAAQALEALARPAAPAPAAQEALPA